MRNKLLNIFILMVSCLVLILSLRGYAGNPTASELNTFAWKENGPFELSPERGRFALTYSLIEDKSFQFTKDVGKFASPDVALHNGRFVSLFAPAVSFITAPGYIVGKYFNVSQVGTFAVIAIFAIINMILIRLIAQRLGASLVASHIASLAFLFATPAFAYGVNLYQHHISTFLILFSIYALVRYKTAWAQLITFALFALSLSVDYPNLFLMGPIAFYAGLKSISITQLKRKSLAIKLHLLRFLTSAIMIFPLFFFLWFNFVSYGNPLQLSGTLKTAKSPEILKVLAANDYNIEKIEVDQRDKHINSGRAVNFFQTRNLVNGFYIHLLSPDRGILIFAPIVLFSVAGFIIAYKKKVRLLTIMFSVAMVTLLLYSMWIDPWGGWAFGSRYLIPLYAIAAVFMAFCIDKIKKHLPILIVFIIVFTYSVCVNTVGALTSSANPPQIEIANLEKQSGHKQEYSIKRNFDYLIINGSKSFVYNSVADDYLTPIQYYLFITLLIMAATWVVVTPLVAEQVIERNYFNAMKNSLSQKNKVLKSTRIKLSGRTI